MKRLRFPFQPHDEDQPYLALLSRWWYAARMALLQLLVNYFGSHVGNPIWNYGARRNGEGFMEGQDYELNVAARRRSPCP